MYYGKKTQEEADEFMKWNHYDKCMEERDDQKQFTKEDL
jgi:hypothetical protein